MSVKLFVTQGGDEHYELHDACENLTTLNKQKFVKALVTSGTWIFYPEPKYNEKLKIRSHKLLTVEDGMTDIEAYNGSARFVPDQCEGVVLYEHYHYGGTELWVKDHHQDLSDIFPPGQSAGVSSAIVLSPNQAFEVFYRKNFEEKGDICLDPKKKYYPTREDIPCNDKIVSIRKRLIQ